jgi:hypothetical protein
MEQTAVEWFNEEINKLNVGTDARVFIAKLFEQAKEMEKQNTDNKVIHFAEWLTKKHSYTLMALYEQFEEQYYNKNFKQD